MVDPTAFDVKNVKATPPNEQAVILAPTLDRMPIESINRLFDILPVLCATTNSVPVLFDVEVATLKTGADRSTPAVKNATTNKNLLARMGMITDGQGDVARASAVLTDPQF